MYYAFIENEKINGCGQCPIVNEEFQNIEITEEVYNNIDHYIWDGAEIILNPNYEQEKLIEIKTQKYIEAKEKAYTFLESGEALYEFEEGKHIEATDGNIGKFTAYALKFIAGSTTPVVWCTKEDETVMLNQEQVDDILQGLGAVQAQVWTVKFTDFVQAINEAETIEEVEAIEIDYTEGE